MVNQHYGKEIEQKLTQEAMKFLADAYNLPLLIPIKINGRLKRVAGRFIHLPGISLSIEIAKDYALNLDPKKLTSLLKHELIHYALFELCLPYKDSDSYFQNELIRHNATLEIPNIRIYIFKCESGHDVHTHRKLRSPRWRCKCGSKLQFEGEKHLV